jgi:hypothetical protein
MVWDGYCRSADSGVPLHDYMAASLPYGPEALRLENGANLSAGKIPSLGTSGLETGDKYFVSIAALPFLRWSAFQE